MLVLIKQAKIVDARSDFHNKVVDILIENGKIKTIAPAIDAQAEHIIEGAELCVSTGWVDLFADYREPGFEQKETIASGLDAAAAGGFTQVFITPNTNPAISTKSVVEFVLRKAAGHLVRLHPLGAISKDLDGKNLAEMLDMHQHGAIAFTDGWKPVQNANLMLKALEYVKAFNGILVQIPVEASLSAGGLMNEGETSTRLGMAGIPEMAETLLLHRDIELLRYTGSRLHVTGISTAASVELVRKAKESALDITCSVTPYHLALTEEKLAGYSSMYKVSPPLRSETDRQTLIAGLKDGTIDCIASHHRPQDWDAKTREFEYAADGMNLQEITFPVLWQTLHNEIDIQTIVHALTTNPRHIFGLEDRGIKEGDIAELTIFTLKGSQAVNEKGLISASANNPFIKEELSGKVVATINDHEVFVNK